MHYTDSTKARDILDNWDELLPRFVKVMPVDYRRALNEMNPVRQQTARNVATGRGQ
ncbi:MAG: hypothetical protein GY731_18395 [Gammaproteobacteria bacterium]|nr:hypothetical protein [Gammaproteobacteria bacterium]